MDFAYIFVCRIKQQQKQIMMTFDNKLSLFIPRVHMTEANEETIKYILYSLGLVERVDLVNKGDYFQAFVHFHVWYESEYTKAVQAQMDQSGAQAPTLQCYQDRPTFFILLKNKTPMTKQEVELERLVYEMEACGDQAVLMPLWCHLTEDETMPEWANELPGECDDCLYDCTEGISANTFINSKEYKEIVDELGDCDDMEWVE